MCLRRCPAKQAYRWAYLALISSTLVQLRPPPCVYSRYDPTRVRPTLLKSYAVPAVPHHPFLGHPLELREQHAAHVEESRELGVDSGRLDRRPKDKCIGDSFMMRRSS